MSLSEQNVNAAQGGNREFQPTHWSIVVTARDAPTTEAVAALDKLCRAYWYPL
jgi:hypothetical protein